MALGERLKLMGGGDRDGLGYRNHVIAQRAVVESYVLRTRNRFPFAQRTQIANRPSSWDNIRRTESSPYGRETKRSRQNPTEKNTNELCLLIMATGTTAKY